MKNLWLLSSPETKIMTEEVKALSLSLCKLGQYF